MKNKFPQEFLLTILIACMLMISFASVNAQTTEIQAEAGAGRNTDEVYTDINPVYHRNPLKAEKKGYNFHAPIINPIVDNKNLIDTKYSQGDTGNTGPSSPINQQNLVIEKKDITISVPVNLNLGCSSEYLKNTYSVQDIATDLSGITDTLLEYLGNFNARLGEKTLKTLKEFFSAEDYAKIMTEMVRENCYQEALGISYTCQNELDYACKAEQNKVLLLPFGVKPKQPVAPGGGGTCVFGDECPPNLRNYSNCGCLPY